MICLMCEKEIKCEECYECNNYLCVYCMENHQHCLDCNGSGYSEWGVMRNYAGEIDYLQGQPTGEVHGENCHKCDRTGIRDL